MYWLLLLLIPTVSPLLLYGCNLADDLCDEGESCLADGLFGQCYSTESGAPSPTVLSKLDDTQLELLRLEISRLASTGEQWTDERTQCTLAYFKLSMQYGLQYDPDFCQVRSPANIWALVQLIDIGLNEDPTLLNQKVAVDDRMRYEIEDEEPQQVETTNETNDDDIQTLIDHISEPAPSEQDLQGVLDDEEQVDPVVEEYLENIVNQEKPDLGNLTDEQLDELIIRLFNMKETLEKERDGEGEEAVPLDSLASQQLQVLKKDAEEVGNVDLGLDNVAHKIVKGRKSAVTRIVGNRVYLKVNIKSNEQLQPLIEYLTNTIAIPNRLIFDDFQFDNGQLSMRIARLAGEDRKDEKTKRKDRIESVEGVAQAVYKRRKDIARYSGAEVAETGIGAGVASVPVESRERDWILAPVLGLCAFTVLALLAVLSVHVAKYARYGKKRDVLLTDSNANVEGKSCDAYEELCRQRMSHEAVRSKSSSTSSWCGEDGNLPSIDISTGHVILNFMQENLSDPQKIESQWQQIENYSCGDKSTTIAQANSDKNRSCLPYDENVVPVDSWDEGEKQYVNASFIYDDDPTQPMYVAAQSPASEQIEAFWQLIWQHGVVLIVNLGTNEETRQHKAYWPDSGSHVHGPFEIHLVSEHIWSEDYLVRSFYLKNLRNGQTRTITQFHYLSWQKDGTPTSAKSLLEFRRKVNKSYRGRSSAVLVHSWDGVGRVGVYCAVDMLCARLVRGVRQLDVAAAIEHLRDQRAGMVRTGDQFKLIYGCVAQEVNALLKALQNQH